MFAVAFRDGLHAAMAPRRRRRGRRLLLAALACACALLSASAAAQAAAPAFVQQGTKLATEAGAAGSAVAISADGSTALVGSPQLNKVTVFTRSGSGWVQQASLTTKEFRSHSPAPQFGAAVALSANGNVAIIGAPGDLEEEGAAFVFTRSGTTWHQTGKRLQDIECVWCIKGAEGGEPESGEIRFGSAVAISADGATAAIGAPGQEEFEGAVQVVSAATGKVTTELVPNDEAKGKTSEFGTSVSISGDGATILAGGAEDGLGGAAWVFTLAESKWTQDGAKLTGAEESGASGFGESVALSADGQTALVGGPFDAAGAGAAWAFARSGEGWTAEGGKLTGGGESGAGQFGSALALSGAGIRALIGGYHDADETGAAWAFVREDTTWSQDGPKLVASGASGAPRFGWSLSLDEAGTLALIGSPHEPPSGDGAARSFLAAAIPAVATGASSEIGKTTATVSATVNPDGEEVTSCLLEYGTTTAYGLSAPCSSAPGSGEEPVAVSAALTGLEPGTAYHYRIAAVNAAGGNTGEDATFSTAPSAPSVSTGSAGAVTSTTATLNATVDPNGGTVSECRFEYGTSPSSLTSSAACSPSPGSGHAPVAVAAFVTGLGSHVSYYFRVTATNSAGTEAGSTSSFETTGGPPEFGFCRAVTAGTGHFANSKCTTSGGKGKYEWDNDVAGTTFTLSAGSSQIITNVRFRQVPCTELKADGEYTSPQTVRTKFVFKGCAAGLVASPGAAEGEMVSAELEGVLGLAGPKQEPALDFYPRTSGTPFLEFNYGKLGRMVVAGSVILPLKGNRAETTEPAKFKAKKAAQEPEELEGGARDVLEISWAGGAYEPLGFDAKLTFSNSAAVEASTTN